MGVLDETAVDNAAGGRVLQSTLAILDEEGLNDPLVDDQEGDLGLDGGLVVALVASGLELGYFPINDLASLRRTHSIPVDDNVGGERVLVVRLERLHGLLEHFFDLCVNNLLSLLLHEEVRVVLGHFLVDRGGKADD